MASRVFTYKKSTTALGTADGSVTFERPLNLAFRGRRRIRLLSAAISSYIPNIYTTSDFTNAIVRVSKDGGTTWSDITLPNGIYTVHYIQSAINKALISWWTQSNDPGFLLGVNTVTDYVYLIIDSTKMAAGQLAIDFGASQIWDLLGFKTTKVFDQDGTFAASDLPKVDWFGNAVSVMLDGVGPLCDENGKDSFELC